MRKIIATFALAAVAGLAQPAFAGDVTVENAWARASAGMTKAGAAFMTVKNAGATADRLVAAKASIAKKVELHTHKMVEGVMMMRRIDGVDVPAGGMAMLKPGGHHVMFMGLHAPLKEGQTFPLTLVFKNAGEITSQVMINSVGAMKGMKHNMGKKL